VSCGERRSGGVLEAFGVVAVGFALLLAAPGALATFALAAALSLVLDLGQRWTFAVASSVLALVALRAVSGWRGFMCYLTVSLAVAFVVVVARFGFKAEWAAEFFRYYKP
jgi:hypothetical protein